MNKFTFHLSYINSLLLHWAAQASDPALYLADPEFSVHCYLNNNIQRAKEWAYQEQVVNEPFNFFFNGDQSQKLFTAVLQPTDTDQEHLRYPLQ